MSTENVFGGDLVDEDVVRTVEVTLKLTLYKGGATQVDSSCVAHEFKEGTQMAAAQVSLAEQAALIKAARELVQDYERMHKEY